MADLLVFKEYYPKVKATWNCICELLMRKHLKYHDITPFSNKNLTLRQILSSL